MQSTFWDVAERGTDDCMKIVDCEKKRKKHEFMNTRKTVEVDNRKFKDFKCKWCPLHCLKLT